MTTTDPRMTTLAIVGRPNVGKSSLLNRIAGRRLAIVEDLAGTTRDRLSVDVDWHGQIIRIIDTGGLETASEALYPSLIREQIGIAIRESDAILFVVDGRDGLTSEDYAVADLLRRAPQPVMLVVNKVDNARRELDAVQFYELGLGDPVDVSAYHGYGISDMLDTALDLARSSASPVQTGNGPAIAIVGRPNVGKSMLLNALLGEERVIVSDVPGTTRDAIDTTLDFQGQSLTVIDTAGIRRRGHIDPGVERHSVMRAQDAVGRCDVAIVVLDATDLAAAQDLHIVQIVEEAQKGLVLAVNKSDLLASAADHQEMMAVLRQRLRFVPWAPIVFISAKARTGLTDLITTAIQAAEQRSVRIATGSLNALLQRAFAEHPPRTVQGQRLKLLYATQADIRPPTFVLFVNDGRLMHFAYRRYLENRLRRAYGFDGTAIRFNLKSRGEGPVRDLTAGASAEGDPGQRHSVTAARRRN